MSQHLILTAELADAVRGQVTPMRALDPVELVDGAYALPVEVLNSPSQAAAARAGDDRLGPVELTDGTYALNLEVLGIPALAEVLAQFGTLPRREVGPDEWTWKQDMET